MDAIVVGSGPNGLAAAITLARAGRAVVVFEAEDTIGGGARTAALTLPGFRHDVCSAVHPLAAASPFFKSLSLSEHGLELVQPPRPLAHPLDGDEVVVLERSMDATAARLGADENRYRSTMEPLVADSEAIVDQFLGPLRVPRHPLAVARFGLGAARSLTGWARRFSGRDAPALFAGMAAHSMVRLDRSPTAGFALLMAMLGHSVGWPVARAGSQAIADSLASYLHSLGGTIETGRRVESMRDLPDARAVLFDVTPRQLLDIAGERLPARYVRALRRFRYGPGVFKIDWALDEPIPWTARECHTAGTIHVGGTLEEIARSEAEVAAGDHPQGPFVIVAQQSRFDDTRAPAGKHTAWAYCHVPAYSHLDMTDRIETQIERFAPGFRDVVTARATMDAVALQAHDANYIGGDINAGLADLRQSFARPVARLNPYATPIKNLYLCSASTPPGGGVHGMCGYFAARAALKRSLA